MGRSEEAASDGNTRIESALWNLRQSNALVNTYLVSGSQVLPVHSVVLCARSKFFRRLLTDISVNTLIILIVDFLVAWYLHYLVDFFLPCTRRLPR